ncbi:MAG TPA: hypothetical protein VM221_08315 [Armatimonadota bacterium]|nr:hypothetical protein [Armatimonadota bacterium]
MPAIVPDEDIGLAFDMHGCPNRCRHCYIGIPAAATGRMTEDDVRWTVAQFRAFRRPGEDAPLWPRIRVSTSVREPDYGDNYRRLYELENELSDLPSLRPRWELLSVWRLARDPEYAAWAHSIGVRVCQMTFFGLEKVTDWAYRRRGAFRDLLLATERLLAAGIRPRWQWFFTKRILPDLPGLIALTRELRLRERCEALGGPFTLFMHCPSPDGEAWHLEHLRPTAVDAHRVSACLREHGEEQILRPLGEPEGRIAHLLYGEHKPTSTAIGDRVLEGNHLWLDILPGFDVYSNLGELTPAWRLGNLKTDGVAAVIDTLENNSTPALRAYFRVPVSELARRYGRPRGRRLYVPDDLKSRWAIMWAQDNSHVACAALKGN